MYAVVQIGSRIFRSECGTKRNVFCASASPANRGMTAATAKVDSARRIVLMRLHLPVVTAFSDCPKLTVFDIQAVAGTRLPACGELDDGATGESNASSTKFSASRLD